MSKVGLKRTASKSNLLSSGRKPIMKQTKNVKKVYPRVVLKFGPPDAPPPKVRKVIPPPEPPPEKVRKVVKTPTPPSTPEKLRKKPPPPSPVKLRKIQSPEPTERAQRGKPPEPSPTKVQKGKPFASSPEKIQKSKAPEPSPEKVQKGKPSTLSPEKVQRGKLTESSPAKVQIQMGKPFAEPSPEKVTKGKTTEPSNVVPPSKSVQEQQPISKSSDLDDNRILFLPRLSGQTPDGILKMFQIFSDYLTIHLKNWAKDWQHGITSYDWGQQRYVLNIYEVTSTPMNIRMPRSIQMFTDCTIKITVEAKDQTQSFKDRLFVDSTQNLKQLVEEVALLDLCTGCNGYEDIQKSMKGNPTGGVKEGKIWFSTKCNRFSKAKLIESTTTRRRTICPHCFRLKKTFDQVLRRNTKRTAEVAPVKASVVKKPTPTVEQQQETIAEVVNIRKAIENRLHGVWDSLGVEEHAKKWREEQKQKAAKSSVKSQNVVPSPPPTVQPTPPVVAKPKPKPPPPPPRTPTPPPPPPPPPEPVVTAVAPRSRPFFCYSNLQYLTLQALKMNPFPFDDDDLLEV